MCLLVPNRLQLAASSNPHFFHTNKEVPFKLQNTTIAIIGLGYVGLPLAVEFGKKYKTIGFDVNQERILELKSGQDRTLEVDSLELSNAANLSFTCDAADLSKANVFIVTVPTPIDRHKRPDLSPLGMASTTIGEQLKKGDVVIYEHRLS